MRFRNSPNLATTKPSAVIVSPVRTHAKSVRSAAKKTRGSDIFSSSLSSRRVSEWVNFIAIPCDQAGSHTPFTTVTGIAHEACCPSNTVYYSIVSFYLSVIALANVKRQACTGSSAALVRLRFASSQSALCLRKQRLFLRINRVIGAIQWQNAQLLHALSFWQLRIDSNY